MKKAKIILTAITMFAVVGGAWHLKPRREEHYIVLMQQHRAAVLQNTILQLHIMEPV